MDLETIIYTYMEALDKLEIWCCGGKNVPYIWMKCSNNMVKLGIF